MSPFEKAGRVAVVAVWSVLVCVAFLGSRGLDGDDHARASTALVALRALQSEFDDQLYCARADGGLVARDLPALLARIETATEALPARIDLEKHPEAATARAAYLDALRAARAPVARHAAATSRVGEARAHAASARAAAASGFAVSDAAPPSSAPNPSLAAAARAIRDLRLGRACDGVVAGYETGFGARLDENHACRIGLFLLTLLLLVRLVKSTQQLELRTTELGTVNRTLEERVDDRTRSLSATNRALESAVAEARRAERDARTARETAESATATKSSFLANMSHEIRTPMTSILGFSERLLDERLTGPERVDAIAAIRRNGEHLSQLVNDILDLSKIEAGMLGVELVDCSPGRIVADLRDAMAPRVEERGLEFAVSWSSRVPLRVRTDPLRVEQVLFNLVGNAIKFTERGRIVVRVGYEPPPAPGGHGRLAFEVEDTGIGMDESSMARLFRPFVQGEASTSRRFGGTGLGLSICSHLVGVLGGAIRVTSRPGSGSTFAFHVDAGPLDVPLIEGPLVDGTAMPGWSADDGPACASSVSGLRVLLAEDGPDNRRLLEHLLTVAGAIVSPAADGEEAVSLALAARAAGRPFDVLLMDMQMPRVDGYEATRRLRAAGYDRPIVALTANAMAPDRERCLAAGCDDYCAKPVRLPVLLEKVGRWRNQVSEDETMAKKVDRKVEADHDAGLVDLVRLFVDELDADLGSMRKALGNGDLATVSTLAHRLKGAAGSYGFPDITRQAASLEKSAQGGETSDSVACELASLEAICAAARRA